MKITGVKAWAVSVPLTTPYRESVAEVSAFQHVISEITTESCSGVGEADFLSLGQDTAPVVAYAVNHLIAGAIVGMDAWNLEAVLARVDEAVQYPLSREGRAGARSCVDLALWDILGKTTGQPVHRLLGGRVAERILVDYTMGAASPDEMAQVARERVKQGYRTLVIKVGRAGLDVDEARVRQVREAVGPAIKLRLDVNGGYRSVHQAVTAIRSMEPYDLELVEQPIPRGDPEALKAVRESVSVPISADESLVDLEDAYELARLAAVDIFNIKPTKCGGLHTSRKIAAVAEAAGIPCLVGGHPQAEIARQASRHFAAALRAVNCGYANEGPGPASQPLVDHLTRKVVTYDDVAKLGGYVEVPTEPGLGVELNRETLAHYTTWPKET